MTAAPAAPVVPATGQSPSNPFDQHAPIAPEDVAADNAPALEPGQLQSAVTPPAVVAAPAATNADQAQPAPSLLDTAAAAFRQNNVLSSLYDRLVNNPDSNAPAVAGYDSSTDIAGYEDYADRFVGSTSPAETQVIKSRINEELADKALIQRAGVKGYALAMAAGLVDPITLTMMLIPGAGEVAGISRLGKIAYTVGTNVALGEAQQAALTGLQETRRYSEGIIPRIGANALLAGVLGTIASRIPKPELAAATAEARANINQPVPSESTASAAAVRETTLEQESVAPGGVFAAKTLGQISPLDRIMTSSEVPEARRVVQRLVDVPYLTNKNLEGIPNVPSVEMVVQQQANARDLQIAKMLDAQYLDYKKTGGALSRRDFSSAVADAANNGDAHDIPQAAAVAKLTRPFFDQDNAALAEAGVPMPEVGKVVGAKSYLPWVWDKHAVLNNQTELENVLTKWFKENPKSAAPAAGGPTVTHEAGEVGGHTFRTDNGELSAQESGEYLLAKRNDTLPSAQGKGEGTARINALVERAGALGKRAGSDVSVSPAEVKTWQKWAREKGIILKENPSDVNPETGNLVSRDPRVPVFETEGRAPAPPPEPLYREPGEVQAAVRDTIDHVLSTVSGTADIGAGIKNPNILNPRSLDLPWELRKKFMSTDFEHITKAYNRTVLPQIEMRRAFPEGFDSALQDIGDKYRVKIAQAGTDDAEKARLTKQQAKTTADLQLLHDRIMNQVGPRLNQAGMFVKAAQLVRTFNYTRTLGGQTLSAPPDLGRLVTRYGLAPTALRFAQYLTRMGRDPMLADAQQRFATAADIVLHTRVDSLQGIGNELAGSDLVSRFARNQSQFFTKVSGIATWDSMMRALSSQLEQDSIARAFQGQPSQWDAALLAQHGIGAADLPAIKAQWAEHGSNEWGLNRARTDLWTDRAAARKVELAVQQAASTTAFYVSKGDLPALANSEFGKMLVQFKAFAMSSVNRLVIPLMQGLAHGDVHAANGAVALFALGGLSYYMKELAAGRKPDLSPASLISNAVQRSGLLAYAPDVYDPIAGMVHLPRFAKFHDLSPADTLLGPSAGTLATISRAVPGLLGGEPNAAELHAIRQLIPYNNVFYWSRLFNMAEGKTADALGLRGAQGVPAMDYLNPTKDVAPRSQTDNSHLFGVEQIPNQF